MEEITLNNHIDALPDVGLARHQAMEPEAASFGELLQNSINNVNQLQNEADAAIAGLASGQQKDIHNTLIAMEKASVAFRFMMEVRNKVISAYETVMRLQV